MADVQKTVEIIFAGVDRVGDSVTSVRSSLGTLEDKVKSVAEPFSKLADYIIKADLAMAAMAAGGIALAINAAGKFQDSFNEIISISGATGDSVGKFKGDIIAYAQDSTQSIESINKSVYDAISAGVSYNDSLELIKTTEKLAVAGRADLDATTMLLVSTMNAYGASTDQAGKYSDVFFQTVKIGQTTVPELAQSLANVSGIAASAGVPIETLGASIAALTASGIKTPEAMTGIKAALENIIKPAEQSKNAAEALGIQFDAGALKTKGFEGVLKDVVTATGGNIDKMAQLFGSVEALNAVLVLGKDKSGIYAKALTDMASAAGSTEAAYKIMSDNMGLATQNLKNNVEVVLVDMGTKILPGFTGDVKASSEVLKSIDFALKQGAFDPLFSALNDAGDAINAFLSTLAKNIPQAMNQVDFSGLVEAIKGVGKSIGGLFDDVDISAPEGLAKVIQAVVDAMAGLTNATSGMIDSFGPWISAIKNSIAAFSDMDVEGQKSAGAIAGAAKALVDGGIAIAAAVVTIGQSGEALKGAFEIITGAIGAVWDTFKAAVDLVVVGSTTALKGLYEVVNALTLGVYRDDIDKTIAKLTGFEAGWKKAFSQNWDAASQNVIMVGEGLVDLAGAAETAVSSVDKTTVAIAKIPDEKTTKVELSYEEALEKVQTVTKGLDGLPLKRDIAISAQTDESSITEAKKAFEWTVDEKGVTVITIADDKKIAETKKTIEDNIPAEKKLSIQAEIDKEAIKAKTDIIKSYFDFKAKVDVAEIEAAAKVMEAAFSSVNSVMENTTKAIGALAPLLDPTNVNWVEIYDLVQKEIAMQQEAVDNQTKLVKAQVKYLESKAKAMDRGDAMITINGDGLKPELEAFMWKILESIQVRVAEEHAEFLLGMGT